MKKILCLLPLPPPHYGSAIASEKNLEILKRSNMFDIHGIKLNYSMSMKDVGIINMSKIKGIFHVRNKIKEEIRTFNPDFIYFAPATSGLGLIRDSYFCEILKTSRVPILFHIHSRANLYKKNSFYYKLLSRMLSGEKAIVLGSQLISDVAPFINKKSIYVLLNAMENKVKYAELNKILVARNKRKFFNILFLSNMIQSKGWPKLLSACKILKERGLSFNCNFVGDWPSKKEESAFFKQVKDNNLLENVFYLGKRVGKEKFLDYKNSDVFVFPTEYPLETFGLVIIEAMMYGLPVIANSVAAIPSIIDDGKTGFLLKENSPEEIADKIGFLINNRKKRSQMGISGRKRFMKYFEISHYYNKFLKIISTAYK